jgi:hypothetical protein
MNIFRRNASRLIEYDDVRTLAPLEIFSDMSRPFALHVFVSNHFHDDFYVYRFYRMPNMTFISPRYLETTEYVTP